MKAQGSSKRTFFMITLLFTACSSGQSPGPMPNLVRALNIEEQGLSEEQKAIKHAAEALPSARLILKESSFYSLGRPNNYNCAGDARIFYKPLALDSTGHPVSFPLSPLRLPPQAPESYKPKFVRNISVDLTNSNHNGEGAKNFAYSCSQGVSPVSPPEAYCAIFDQADNPTFPLSTAVRGYNTGYYSVFDANCHESGAVQNGSTEVNRFLVGGLDIDIDRTALKPGENLLLHLKYYPLGTGNTITRKLEGGTTQAGTLSEDEKAAFQVHLLSIGLNQELVQSALQPRHLIYSDEQKFPKVLRTFKTLAPPVGAVREEQMLIPLSQYAEANRIRIERYSGTGIFLELSLYRLGPR